MGSWDESLSLLDSAEYFESSYEDDLDTQKLIPKDESLEYLFQSWKRLVQCKSRLKNALQMSSLMAFFSVVSFL